MINLCLSTALSVLCGLGSAQATPGTLNVQVETPAYGSVARGAQRVPVAIITLAVPCSSEAATVNSVTIQRSGLGLSSDIARAYLLSGTSRISRAYPLPSKDDPLTLIVRGLKISPCASEQVVLAVDFSSQAQVASEHVFRVQAVEAKNATVTIDDAAQSTLQVGASGTPAVVTAELLPVLTSINYGRNRTVARLSVQGTAGKDQRITAITLTNNGSAKDTDLQNLAWYTRTGERISAVIPQMQGRTARIVLDAFLLEGRDTKLIELRADVRASRKRTIRWELEETADIEAMEVRTR